MDKYEIAEVLQAAADGIRKRDRTKELQMQLDNYKKICYTLLKFGIVESLGHSYTISGFGSNATDDLIANIFHKAQHVDEFVSGKEIKNKTDEAYKMLFHEDPPKEN